MLALSIGLTACQQTTAPTAIAVAAPLDNSSFESCVNREAKKAVRHYIEIKGDVALYGYPLDAENDIIAICNPSLKPEGVRDNILPSNPSYKYLNSVVEAQAKAARDERAVKDAEVQRKQAAQDAPRLKAEKAEEDAAGKAYYRCLVQHAQELAANSTEPAETIAQASFPACTDDRQAFLETYRRHNNYSVNWENIDIIDAKFKPSLLLEIIKARGLPAPAQPPS